MNIFTSTAILRNAAAFRVILGDTDEYPSVRSLERISCLHCDLAEYPCPRHADRPICSDCGEAEATHYNTIELSPFCGECAR